MNTQYKKGVLELCVLALVLTEPKTQKACGIPQAFSFYVLLSYEVKG